MRNISPNPWPQILFYRNCAATSPARLCNPFLRSLRLCRHKSQIPLLHVRKKSIDHLGLEALDVHNMAPLVVSESLQSIQVSVCQPFCLLKMYFECLCQEDNCLGKFVLRDLASARIRGSLGDCREKLAEIRTY